MLASKNEQMSQITGIKDLTIYYTKYYLALAVAWTFLNLA